MIVPTLRVGMQPLALGSGAQSAPGGIPTRSVGTITRHKKTPPANRPGAFLFSWN